MTNIRYPKINPDSPIHCAHCGKPATVLWFWGQSESTDLCHECSYGAKARMAYYDTSNVQDSYVKNVSIKKKDI